MSTLSALLILMESQLQDQASALSDAERLQAVTHALIEYSRRRPARQLYDMSGDGTTVEFALPSDWQEDWSAIVAIESPQGEDPQRYLDPAWYHLTRTLVAGTTVLRLRFLSAPANGDTARMEYTAPRTAAMVPSVHEDAVATLAAAIAAQWLAQRYAQQTETTLSVDIADRDSRSRAYAERAKELRGMYDLLVPAPIPRRTPVLRG